MTSEKREKAIKYLTEEIRSLRMAPQINGCAMTPEWAEQISVLETCLKAVRSEHFADAGKMQLLTVEQLREVPHGKIKDSTLKNICRRANEIAYPHAHIDRDAWEPCGRCRSKENALDRFSGHEFLIDDAEIYFYDSEDGWEGEEIMFCPWCGRPLTEKAWDEVEKRVRGDHT